MDCRANPGAVEAFSFVPDRPGHDLRYALDSTKLRRELGWAPTTPFEQGLAATIWQYHNPKG